jgi:hypothetical protein
MLSGILPSYLAWQYNRLERFGFVIISVALYKNIEYVVELSDVCDAAVVFRSAGL